MNTMNASLLMDRIGMSLINAILLAGLPIGVIAALSQSF